MREGNRGPYIEEVDCDQNHALFLAIDGSGVVDDGTWLAPIPGPGVLAALEEYTIALLQDISLDRKAAGWLGLIAAIRAERDGDR